MDLTPEITFAVLSDMKHTMMSCKIVLWVNSISTELAFQAMGLGVRGILRKTLPTDLQVKCLQKVQAGELWFEKALTDSFLCARRIALTQREGQLVSLLSQGLKSKEIATQLMISEGTVKVYLSRLFQKVGVKDRFELALFGLKNLTTGQLPVNEKGQRTGTSSMPGLRSLVLERSPAEGGEDRPRRFEQPPRSRSRSYSNPPAELLVNDERPWIEQILVGSGLSRNFRKMCRGAAEAARITLGGQPQHTPAKNRGLDADNEHRRPFLTPKSQLS